MIATPRQWGRAQARSNPAAPPMPAGRPTETNRSERDEIYFSPFLWSPISLVTGPCFSTVVDGKRQEKHLESLGLTRPVLRGTDGSARHLTWPLGRRGNQARRRMVNVALLPNDDGYGPSALGSYVARALLESYPEVSLIVQNQAAERFNRSLYDDKMRSGKVEVRPAFGGIRLTKTEQGGVNPLRSLADVRAYEEHARHYVLPDHVDFVVDIGTPAGVAAARRRGIPAFTVFDHSWAKTYEMLLSEFCQSLARTLCLRDSVVRALVGLASGFEVERAIRRMKEDEAKTTAVFLFPEFITPSCYYEHWKKGIKVRTVKIKGVFGGRGKEERREARQSMGLDPTSRRKAVYLLSGGTEIWDAKIPQIIRKLRRKRLAYDIVIFDRRAKAGKHRRIKDSCIVLVGPPKNGTVQALLPGIDLIITRAGGGIVNDAIACRVPLVCVEEPGHVQVEMIRENCQNHGLTRRIWHKDFDKHPVEEIEKAFRDRAGNQEIKTKMAEIENHKEFDVADRIVELYREHRGGSGAIS